MSTFSSMRACSPKSADLSLDTSLQSNRKANNADDAQETLCVSTLGLAENYESPIYATPFIIWSDLSRSASIAEANLRLASPPM